MGIKSNQSPGFEVVQATPAILQQPPQWIQRTLRAHLELIHDFADGFAPCSNDAGMNTMVKRHIFRDHLLQLAHNLHDGVSGCLCVLLIASYGDLILGLGKQVGEEVRMELLGANPSWTSKGEV